MESSTKKRKRETEITEHETLMGFVQTLHSIQRVDPDQDEELRGYSETILESVLCCIPKVLISIILDYGIYKYVTKQDMERIRQSAFQTKVFTFRRDAEIHQQLHPEGEYYKACRAHPDNVRYVWVRTFQTLDGFPEWYIGTYEEFLEKDEHGHIKGTLSSSSSSSSSSSNSNDKTH